MPATITRVHAIVCPSCHKTGKASDSFIGRNVICSACGSKFMATLADEPSLMIARAALNHALLYLQQIIKNAAGGVYTNNETNLMSDLAVVMDVCETGLEQTIESWSDGRARLSQ